jgi:molybdate transport system substrate-binding protein
MRRRLLLASLLAAPVAAQDSPPLRVLGTGAVEHPLHDLTAAFSRATGQAVTLETGNGGQVAAQVRAGEGFDLVVNAAAALDAMVAEGLLDPATRMELGRVRIGLAVRVGTPPPDISTPEALRAALLAAPSIAHSDAAAGATTGRHILAMLESLGIAEAVAARRQPFTRGLAAAQAVAEGRAALVMTQTGEIVVVPGVALVGPLPESLQLVTPYVAAVPVRAAQPAAARALLAALTAEAGKARFRAAGFAVG